MCNGYPALRCSRHAKDLLYSAQKRLDSVTTWREQEQAEKLLIQATKIFYTTPAGFKEIEKKIEEETNPLEKDKLFSALQEGKLERRNSQSEYNRIHRVNKNKIEDSKILRLSGLPWWVVASQLNVDLIEEQNDIKLINDDPGLKHKNIDTQKPDGTYYIDVRNQSFTINTVEEKYLSINNRHSLLIYKDLYSKDSKEPKMGDGEIKLITDKYSDRGENKAIEYEELLDFQKILLWRSIKDAFVGAGFTRLVVSDPKIGITKIISIEDIASNFKPTLYTTLKLHNGTDKMTEKNIDSFNKLDLSKLFIGEAIRVNDKYLIKTTHKLQEYERFVKDFVLIPIKDDIYEIKKNGNIRGESVRVVLTLKGE